MPTLIDELIVSVGLDPEGEFTKGRKRVEDDLDKTKAKAKKTASDIESAGKRGSSFFKEMRGEVLALFALFTAGRGLKEFVADMAVGEAQAGRFAKILHESTEELSAWQNVAILSGGTADGMTGSMQTLQSQYQQFLMTGESSVIPYFRALGVQISDVATGKMRPMGDILLDLADKFQGMDPARAAEFGKNLGLDPGTINTLLLGRKAIQGMLDDQKALGVITKEDAEAGAAYQKAWGEMTQASSSAGRALMTILAPALIAILKVITWIAEFLIAHKGILVAVFAALTVAVLALSAAMISSLAGAAVTAMVEGFALLTGGFVDLMVTMGALTEVALPALADAFIATGLAMEATPIGWIITAVAALAFAAYELYEHWDAIKRWWHRLWGDMSDDAIQGADTIDGAADQLDHKDDGSPGSDSGDWRDGIGTDKGGQKDRKKGGEGGGTIGFLGSGSGAEGDINALVGMGWTREQASGIAASIQRESLGNPAAVGDGGAAYGISQWHKDRQEAFKQWSGHDIRGSSRAEQLAFINYELREGGERRAGELLSKTKTAGDAGAVVSKYYERPADVEGEAMRRGQIAERLARGPQPPPQAGAKDVAMARNTNNSRTSTTTNQTNIAKVEVKTAATDAKGIARDLGTELQHHTLATQANSGAA